MSPQEGFSYFVNVFILSLYEEVMAIMLVQVLWYFYAYSTYYMMQGVSVSTLRTHLHLYRNRIVILFIITQFGHTGFLIDVPLIVI